MKRKNLTIFIGFIGILVLSFCFAPDALADWTTGQYGLAYDFNGVSDFIYAGDIGSARSVSFWIKSDSLTQKIMTLDGGTHYLEVSAGTLSAQGFDNPVIYVDGVEASTIDTADWHHIAVVTETTIGADAVLWGKVNISGTNYFFDGIIDELYVYNRALSAEEVRFHYNRGGPVAHWTFDEGNGTTTYDGTENGNDGTLGDGACSPGSGTCPAWTTGKYGTGLLFDGEDDYVSHSKTLSSATDFTIEVWVKAEDIVGQCGIINFRTGNLRGIGIDIDSNHLASFKMRAADGTITPLRTPTSVSGEWTHLVGTYVNATNKMLFYRNGEQVNSGSGQTVLESSNQRIGSNLIISGGTPKYFLGIIDDVRIYNYARSEAEIKQDYNEGYAVRVGLGTDCDRDPDGCMNYGLVGYWGLDEGGGTTAYDGSDYSNDGTLGNGACTPGSGSCPSWTIGEKGGALEFDGVNDYVNCGSGTSLEPTSAITLETWVNMGAQSTNFRYITFKNYSSCFSTEGTGADTYLMSYYQYDSVDDQFRMTVSDIPRNEWHHFVATCIPNGGACYLYKDGIQVDSNTFPNNPFKDDSAQDFYIGWTGYSPDALIDEVRIYNRALSAEEVRYHYNRGEPVAHWRFDEGSGQVAFDESDNNNDGTLGASASPASDDPQWVSGYSGSALQFDGENDYVDCGSDASLNPGSSDFTYDETRIKTKRIGLCFHWVF